MSAAAEAVLGLVAPEDRMRADLYDYLGLILSRPPNAGLLQQTAELTGDSSDLGEAISGLARVANVTKPKAAEREFNTLFVGLSRGELLPYASYYLTGFLNEKPLAQLRGEMAERQIARAENVFEPEDNIASLMEMMGGLIMGRFGSVAELEEQKAFFDKHIGPWAGHFFTDLESTKSSVFYASVGAVGRLFMDIEQEAFRMGTG
ncbi:MAG: molecular chaperone [Rhizobiaceae bacterium]